MKRDADEMNKKLCNMNKYPCYSNGNMYPICLLTEVLL